MATSLTYGTFGNIFAITLIITLCAQFSLEASEFIDIAGKSFSLISQIRSYTLKKNFTIGKLKEHYSAEQKRARIDFNFKVQSRYERIGTWFVDTDKNITLELDRALKCQSSSVGLIKDLINFNLEDSGETAEIDNYVIGPARVLLIIEKYRNRLQKFGSPMPIRNMQCVRYTLEYSAQSGSKILINVDFSKESLKNGNRAHPIRVSLHLQNQHVFVDYLQIKLLDSENLPTPLETNGRISARGSNVNFDLFMFEPKAGCSEAIREVHEFDLFENQPESVKMTATKFSFEAQVDELDPQDLSKYLDSSRKFVAFHYGLSSMRVDTYKQSASNQENDWQAYISGPDDRRKSKQIFNFKMSSLQIYHMNEISIKGRGRDHDKQNSRCVVTDLNYWDPDQDNGKSLDKLMSVGNLLVGAEKFVYMGKAQVRGIAARVYEAPGGSVLPLWLDQPIVYKNLMRRKEMRYSDSGIGQTNGMKPRSSGLKRVVLVYLAENDSNHPLLLIEIITMDPVKFTILDMKSIQIYNFAWDLVESSGGRRALKLFSLAGTCTEYRGSSSHVEMLLKSEELIKPVKEDDRIFSADLRNIALMGTLRKRLMLPTPMVYGLESRLISSTPSERLKKHYLKLVVSFNAAETIRSKAELSFLGFGTKRDTVLTAYQSFRDCFYQAAHMQSTVEFAYLQGSKACFIASPREVLNIKNRRRPQKDAALVDESPKDFLLDPNGTLEIYRVQHSKDSNEDNQSPWVREIPAEQSGFLGMMLRLNVVQNSSMLFTIKSIQKELENPQFNGAKNSGLTNGGGVIIGVGLPESSEGNERIRPAPTGAFNWSPLSHKLDRGDGSLSRMSLAQCQASCLRDLECRSFSVCVSNSEIECVTSKTSFKSEEILEQIGDQLEAGQSTKRTGAITVSLADGKSVELAKHPNCELHNKNYMSLFERRIITSINLTKKFAIAARSRVECAQACLLHNIDVLKEDVDRMSKAFSSSFGTSSSSSSEAAEGIDSKELRTMIGQHKEAVGNIRRSFLFLEVQKLRRLPNLIQQFNEFVLSKGTNKSESDSSRAEPEKEISGYCLFESESGNNSEKEEIFSQVFEVEKHMFRIDSFYEKQYGVSIRNSGLTKEQSDAYRDFRRKGNKASETSFSTLNSLVNRGYNIQQFIYATPAECARHCFTQATEMWPACRSFDVIIAHGLYRCHLNSITLNQAIANSKEAPLISISDDVQVWHYEPLGGFIEKEVILSGDIELAEENNSIHSRWIANGGSDLRLHSLGLLVIILLGLFGGFILGIRLGQRISNNNETSASRVDVEGLVEPTSIGFANHGRQKLDVNL